MTVEARIVSSELPESVPTDKSFSWDLSLRTTGTGMNFIGGGLFERPLNNGDRPVDNSLFVLKTEGGPVEVPPGMEVSGTVTVEAVDKWKTPVPDELKLSAVVGWFEITDQDTALLHATDIEDHTVTVETPLISRWILIAGGIALGTGALGYLVTKRGGQRR